jgi:hypothetical protein
VPESVDLRSRPKATSYQWHGTANDHQPVATARAGIAELRVLIQSRRNAETVDPLPNTIRRRRAVAYARLPQRNPAVLG